MSLMHKKLFYKTIAAVLLVGFLNHSAFASTKQQLVISINKKPQVSCQLLLDNDLTELKNFLMFSDPTMGTEYVQAKIVQYIDFCKFAPDVPYYGIAIVELEFTSEGKKASYIDRITQSGDYTFYENPGIGCQ